MSLYWKKLKHVHTISVCQGVLLWCIGFVTAQLFAGRQCTTGGYSIVRGECKPLKDCPAALSNLRAGVNPSLCYQENGIPYICCQNDYRISAIKCDEYTKQVTDLLSKSDIQPFYVGGYVDPSRFTRTGNCNNTKQALISGGRDADIDEMSYTVALGYIESGSSVSWKCGGTLVSEQFVVTAAHCVDGVASKPPTRVLLGDKRLQTLDTFSRQRRVEANVEEVIIHPDYQRPVKYHDIAIIKLDRKVKFTRAVQPACLPRPELRPETFTEFLTAGWGRLEFGGKRSDVLQVVTLQRFNLKECNKVYVAESDTRNSAELPEGIIKSQICAGDKDGDRDSCDGDSGGPLTAKKDKADCIHHLVGITSFGTQFCGYSSPAVYTNVQSYLDWIESIVWPGLN